MVSYALGGGVALHAQRQAFEREQARKYKDPCLAYQERLNPMDAGMLEEAKRNWGEAYAFYRIALLWGYGEAEPLLQELVARMTPEQKASAEAEFAKYSEAHINTCFIGK